MLNLILKDRYRLEQLLAQGGMGAVYQGFDLHHKTPVAVKENAFRLPASIRQFKEEAHILERVSHPGLPRMIEHFSYGGRQYLVMEFIAGQSLWQMVEAQGGDLPESRALKYIIQVCKAVTYLHRQTPPIIHRDIKPENIKITPTNQAILVDFGIAKVAAGNDGHTQTGAKAITPGFSPPEQYRGGTTPASDLYALGATLYAILTGQKPQDSIRLLTGKLKFIPPDHLNNRLSGEISQAIQQAMQLTVRNRPQSVDLWQAMLESLPEASDATGTHTSTTAPLMSDACWLVGPNGLSYRLKSGDKLMLGRGSQCDIRLADPLVSRLHATLKFDGYVCLVYDEKSANGTYINEQRIGGTSYPFNPGDQLRLGSTLFSVSQTNPEASDDLTTGYASVQRREKNKKK
jgi:serine/threonine-protein kinase